MANDEVTEPSPENNETGAVEDPVVETRTEAVQTETVQTETVSDNPDGEVEVPG